MIVCRPRGAQILVPACLVVACLLGVDSPALGQTAATLTGTVTDVSGGVLADARLTLQHSETGLTRSTTTSADGRFVFAGVPVGQYDLRVEHVGFHPLVRQGVLLTVGQTLGFPLT